jgi:hypothetical protein
MRKKKLANPLMHLHDVITQAHQALPELAGKQKAPRLQNFHMTYLN